MGEIPRSKSFGWFLLADFFVAVSHLRVFGYSILVLSSDQIKSSLTIPQIIHLDDGNIWEHLHANLNAGFRMPRVLHHAWRSSWRRLGVNQSRYQQPGFQIGISATSTGLKTHNKRRKLRLFFGVQSAQEARIAILIHYTSGNANRQRW